MYWVYKSINNNSIRKCTLHLKSATNEHLFFQVAFINSVLNSLKWHFPLLLWTTSTGVCEVSPLQKSHQEEILTLLKKQWQKKLNIFLGRLTSYGPTTTILENYASNNNFSNSSKNLLPMPLVCFYVVTPCQLSSQGAVTQYYQTIKKCSLLLIVTKQPCEVLWYTQSHA